MSTPATSPAKIYIKKPQFRRLYLMYTTTLAQVAKDNYIDVKSLLILNPEIISANEPICHLFLTLPNRVNFNERDLKKKEETGATFAIVKDPLRPVSQRIRPKISEIFRLFVDFDHQTHKYLKEIRKLFQAKNVWPLEKGCELITHIDCWDESFVPTDLICGVKRSSYLNYR
ncbi:MAG TPA: hypothetical protein VHO70_22890, partial [Chitinispirillaceae bacterium]|nr:hypothetical protein [Chitinispirillaceae bacterium]